MRVQLPKKYLNDVLGHAERIIPNKSSNPSLSLLGLQVQDDVLSLSGSNMDIDIKARLRADIEGSGKFAMPASVFAQVVKSLPGELVELNFEEREVDIRSGSYATKLQLSDSASLSQFEFPDSYKGSIKGTDLANAFNHVRYAAAVAEYQAIFRGVKVELKDNHTRAIATDGFRLAYYHSTESTGLEGDMVIPARSVEELARILTDDEAKLELTPADRPSQLSVQSGHYQLNVKLMEGDFPDYSRVIPEQSVVSITLDSKQLLESVSRVAVMADKTTNNRVDMFIQNGELQITAEGGYGRSQEAIEVSQEGAETEIALAYNSKYLEDALKPIQGEVRLSFSGTTSPSLIASTRDPSYLAMVVPLRT